VSVILLLWFLITLSVCSWIVCHSSSTIFDYPFGIFVNCLSFFFYDFWLPFRYLRELSVILLQWKILEEEWQTIHEETERVMKNPRRRMTSVILLLGFLITLSVSSWIICHSSSTIFDYPFGFFVNYLSFFFCDFWLLFNSRRYRKGNQKS
jgi:uncharacterized membrane protein